MTTDDLWGELPEADATVKPSTLLREQASLLASKTSNVLEGLVREVKARDGALGLEFFILCPALDNYTFHVLSVKHDLLDIFPATVFDIVRKKKHDVANEDDLRRVMKEIFTSDEVRRVIAALLREATVTA